MLMTPRIADGSVAQAESTDLRIAELLASGRVGTRPGTPAGCQLSWEFGRIGRSG